MTAQMSPRLIEAARENWKYLAEVTEKNGRPAAAVTAHDRAEWEQALATGRRDDIMAALKQQEARCETRIETLKDALLSDLEATSMVKERVRFDRVVRQLADRYGTAPSALRRKPWFEPEWRAMRRRYLEMERWHRVLDARIAKGRAS
jgi:hypothetical protein